MKTIEIDGVLYALDVEKCIRDGYLKKELVFKIGGVYTDPKKNTNDFVLTQALFVSFGEEDTKRAYALLGLGGGFSSNSGPFFENTLHTKEEILTYLKEKGMVFSYKANKVFK